MTPLRRLEAAAREWKQVGELAKSDYLYHGARLVEAEEWANKQERIPDDVREFLEASGAARKAAARKECEAQQREIAQQKELREQAEARAKVEERLHHEARSSAVRSRRFSYALGVAVLLVGGLSTIARQQRLTGESRMLAVQAEQMLGRNRSGALDLALRQELRAISHQMTTEC